jgi:hypothetical protein
MSSPSTGQVPEQALAARAFARSLNMLLKYVRMYGIRHKRSSDQFEIAWKELRAAVGGASGLLIGVSGSKLLVDGVPLETGGAEKAFTELVGSSGIGSFQFLPSVTTDEFERMVQAFSLAKPNTLLTQLKMALSDWAQGSIRINEVRYVQHDPSKPEGTGPGTGGELSNATPVAAHLATTAITDNKAVKFGNWLNDPNKLLQLIIAAHGDDKRGAGAGSGPGQGGEGSSGTGSGSGTGEGTGSFPGGGHGGPVAETEVLGILRWLTQLGKTEKETDPATAAAAMEASIADAPKGNARSLVQQTLAHLAKLPQQEGPQPSMLIKLAENLAIRFALERYERGEVKVNAVRDMLERMNKEMEDLRKVLSTHEETISKAGISVESRAEILDRQFWASVPERGKLGVLLTPDAYCIPARNVRSFVEELLIKGDNATATKVLRSYLDCVESKEADARRKCAIGLSDLPDLYSRVGGLLAVAVNALGERLIQESDAALLQLGSAAFVRFSQEANNHRDYDAIAWSLHSLQQLEQKNPGLAKDVRPRVAVEGRIREFIEDALQRPEVPHGLVNVLRWTPRAAVEHGAARFAQCQKRQECEALLALFAGMGDAALEHLRAILTTRPAAEAVASAGPLSRLDADFLAHELPARVGPWGRAAQDSLVRQLGIGGSPHRGVLLTLVLPALDPLIMPLALDEIGMSGDKDAVPALIKLAQGTGPAATSGFLRLKAIEALGRLHDKLALDVLARIVTDRSFLSYKEPRELRIAAAQSMRRIDAARAQKVVEKSGLEPEEWQFAPLEIVPSEWTRSRRYPRVAPRGLTAVAQTSKGRVNVTLTGLSLGGGVAVREGRVPIAYEAVLELPSGMRRLRGQVLVRENRAREITFEIVNIDLEDLAKLRKILNDLSPAAAAPKAVS